MKRIYIIAILITVCGLTAMAQDRPDMTHQTTGRDRVEFKSYADQPNLVYDSETNQIAVYGNESEFYDVNITSLATQQIVFIAVINGQYDIIDAAIMSNGSYQITLVSSHGNVYQWTFDHGLGTPFNGFDPKGELNNLSIDFNKPVF